jgi:hypothetical protein
MDMLKELYVIFFFFCIWHVIHNKWNCFALQIETIQLEKDKTENDEEDAEKPAWLHLVT